MPLDFMENRPSPNFLNIFQESTGYYSYMRVWGSILNVIAITFLIYGVYFSSPEKATRAIETAWIILGITMTSKVAQKFSEPK